MRYLKIQNLLYFLALSERFLLNFVRISIFLNDIIMWIIHIREIANKRDKVYFFHRFVIILGF